MAQKTPTYSLAQLAQEISRRLSPIHKVGSDFVTGKNKITFTVNDVDVIINKDKDENGNKRTIVECRDMFPCSFYNENTNAVKYTEAEVIRIVNHIDRYFIEKLGFDPDVSAICTKYIALKWALLPFFVTDFKDEESISKVQEEILNLLSFKAFSGITEIEDFKNILLCFTGRNINTDIEDKAFILTADSEKITVFVVNYKDGILTGDNDEDENIKQYLFKYSDFFESQNLSAVKKILKTHYQFKLCDIVFKKLDEQEGAETE